MEIYSIIGSVCAVVLGWYFNERSRRTAEEYHRKEERYIKLLHDLPGFYEDPAEKEYVLEEMKKEFIEQMNQLWLYAPDEIIKKASAFLKTVEVYSHSTYGERKKALGEFIIAIRQDLINTKPLTKTGLKENQFEIWVNKKKTKEVTTTAIKEQRPSSPSAK
jgi:hypothetical protein